MRIFSPFIGRDNRKFDNTNRLARIRYRLKSFSNKILVSLGKVPLTTMIRAQFPFILCDSPAPPRLSVELTNHCNLACVYCSNPLKLRPQGFMEPTTFSNLIRQVKDAGIPWIGLCGNGEPTLHPKFPSYVRQLAAVTRFLTLTTNWQRIDEETMISILEAPVNLIYISVDGGDKEGYESMRLGGKFERLLKNLTLLKRLKNESRSSTQVEIRLMLQPSDHESELRLLNFWRGYGDVVTKQYIFNLDSPSSSGYDTVVYKPGSRCTLPFKILDVNWNGNVPLCTYSRRQTGNPNGLPIGNINESSLLEMWNGKIIKQYREGHRRKNEDLLPICQGCPGRT